jgi:hypothetical protein
MCQDMMSATWRKERSTVETNEIMKTAAHQSWVMMLMSAFIFFVSCLDAVGVRPPLLYGETSTLNYITLFDQNIANLKRKTWSFTSFNVQAAQIV